MSNKEPADFDRPGLSDQQKGVARGMALGALATLIAAAATLFLDLPAPAVPAGTVLLASLGLIGLPLAASIAAVAHHRFFHAAAIDGTNDPADAALVRLRATLQNTLEQTLLAALSVSGLAAALPAAWLGILPAMTALFIAGRIGFAVGYRRGAAARAFGFALTFYPSFVGLLAAPAILLARRLG